MAHYAFLDENNIVTEVIVGVDETELIEGKEPEVWYAEFRGQSCKRTSYNTLQGQHLADGVPFRGNYAGIGYTYDEALDGFISPKPYDSWLLDETTYSYKAPVEYPTDGAKYQWNEDIVNWELVETEEL